MGGVGGVGGFTRAELPVEREDSDGGSVILVSERQGDV